MVTETREETVTQPEVETPPAPELESEQTPVDDTAELDSILESLTESEEDGKGDGPSTEGTAPPERNLTPDEIRAQERQRLQSEQSQQAAAAERKRIYDGAKESLTREKANSRALATQLGLDPTQVEPFEKSLEAVHGNTMQIVDYEKEEQRKGFSLSMYQAALEALPENLQPEFVKDGAHPSTPQFMAHFKELVTQDARKGYKSPSEVKAERRAAQVSLLKKLRDLGVDLPADTNLNQPSDQRATSHGGTGMSGHPRTMSAYLAASMEDRARWEREDPTLLERLDTAARRASM